MQDTVIDFLRHGEPAGGRRYRGDGVDDPLSEHGWRQMWSTVGEFDGWDVIISSPMQRCHAFARALGEKIDRAVVVDPRFREVGMGSWEGRSPQEILDTDPEAYASFYRDPVANRPAGCEPLDAFGRRVAEAYDAVLAGYPGRHVLVVAHAGVIRAAVGYILQADPVAWYRTAIDTAGATRFRHGEFGNKLEFHNRQLIACR
jgi:broad specificity phosphatase PhoE